MPLVTRPPANMSDPSCAEVRRRKCLAYPCVVVGRRRPRSITASATMAP